MNEEQLREAHIPSVGGYCDSEIYLECSCGWNSETRFDFVAMKATPTPTWLEHLALATLSRDPHEGATPRDCPECIRLHG